MKKYLLLTSVLALAACGGGSGGGSAVDERSVAIANNAKITGMNSFVVVGGNNPTVNTNARIATTLSDGGKEYDLSDVVFYSTDKQFSGNPDDDFRVKLVTNKAGEIVALDTVDDGASEKMEKKQGSDNKFGRDYDSGDGFDYATLNLLGASKGMQYADFGFIEVYGTDDAENPMFIMPIAGGYEVKKVTENMDKDNFTSDVVFKGIAVGNVGEPDTTVVGERLMLRDNNATLTFKQDTGNEVLNASFNNWYDVVATRYTDGDAQIAFSNGDRITDDRFKLKEGSTPTDNFDTGKIENNTDSNNLSVGFDYYGDAANNPGEATGLIFYQQNNEVQPFMMGFGGVRKY